MRAGRSRSFREYCPDDVATGRLRGAAFSGAGFRHSAFASAQHVMLWSRERQAGFQGEIEKVFRDRGPIGTAAGDRGRSRSQQLSSSGGDEVAPRCRAQRAACGGDGGVAWVAAAAGGAVFGKRSSWGFELLPGGAGSGAARSGRRGDPRCGRRGAAVRNRASAAVEHPHRRRADRTNVGGVAG